MIPKHRIPSHPGEILADEFLRPAGITQSRLAEHLGIGIASGCRAGNCGTCVLAMQSGEVSYIQPPGSPPEARTCLTCIAQPKGDIVLDA